MHSDHSGKVRFACDSLNVANGPQLQSMDRRVGAMDIYFLRALHERQDVLCAAFVLWPKLLSSGTRSQTPTGHVAQTTHEQPLRSQPAVFRMRNYFPLDNV
jgi:hypothetical protein